MSWWSEPWAYEFFRNGVVVAVVAGALCGLVGTWVVLRNMSYIGHGLSHAVFGGAAVGSLVGAGPVGGAGVWAVLSALAIGRVARRRGIGADAAIGVVTTASFAAGLALFARYGQARRSTEALLFGSILGVDTAEVALVAGVGAVAVATVVLGYRRLLFVTFDPEVAAVTGVRTGRVDAALHVVLAVTILAAMQVLGVILVAAALVIPPAATRLVTHDVVRMLTGATAVGAVTGGVGMFAAWHLDVPPGAAIVLAQAAVFAVAYGLTAATPTTNMRQLSRR